MTSCGEDFLLLCDSLAHRYGGSPASYARMSPEDFAFSVMSLQAARKVEARRIRDMDGPIFPAIILGGA